LIGRFSWMDWWNSLFWCSFVDRIVGEIILIISMVSVCSESLLIKSYTWMMVGEDSVDSCCELRFILNELNDKQLLDFDWFGCGLVEGNIAVISIPLDPYNFALMESYDIIP
jgi:hypothetical protein